ncbi:MAG: hypothetical protein PGN23_07260 [Sphingomonas adhaesiva]|uniref:hypothetical protein n=1 Tax=Sphingomonas adhaesiva TaxID=28212 RepID=UPI002FF9C0A2
MRASTILRIALAIVSGTAANANAQSSGVDTIRLYSDGAGPSHIVRVGRTRAATGDVVAIVDPLLSAVRIFEVRDAASDETLATRISSRGACALPVSFRPWRIHSLSDKILIESMPDPGTAGYLVRPENLRTTVYSIDRATLAAGADTQVQAGAILDTQAWTPATAPPCGTVVSSGRPYAAAPERAVRGAKNPARTIILTNRPSALAPTEQLIVRSPADARYRMISARELEPAGGYRFVLTAEAARAESGTVNVTQRLLAFSAATRQPVRELRFDPSTIRSKLGQRPIAILSTGEVLVMGKAAGTGAVPVFKLFSCGRLMSALPTTTPLCDATQDTIAGRSSADLVAVSQTTPPAQEYAADEPRPTGSFNSQRIFANVAALAKFPFRVDTTRMPEACRVIQGCTVTGSSTNFVPIRGVRLTRGTFERTGVPYAQAGVPGDADRLMQATPAALSNALAAVRSGAGSQPGNLADGFEGDLGVDCSGLVQIAWNGRTAASRLSTASLGNFEGDLVCDAALPAPEYLRPGDALNTHTKQVNHVMLFASAMTLDGGNDEWLMLESSSSCDGVCWSVYDPSFFGGWELRRARGRSDVPCIRKRRKA